MEFITSISNEEHDAFVKGHPLCNLLQSSSWAKVKDNWEHEIVGVKEDGKIIASALVLIKKLPLGFTMMYTPRGPILDYENAEVVTFFMKNIKKWAKKYHCLFIKMDPNIVVQSYKFCEEKQTLKQIHMGILSTMNEIGVIHKGFSAEMDSTIQPRLHMIVYKDNFDLDHISKKAKKNIKIAENTNLEIVYGGMELVNDFAKVMKSTEERKNILLRNKEYFELLMKIYHKNAFIVLAYLNLEQEYKKVLEKYNLCILELENCSENSKKKRFTLTEQKDSLERQKKNLENSLSYYGKKVCVSGTLTIVYGKTSEILYAGMNDSFKRYMAPYLTWFKTMEECFNRNCSWSNMGGIKGTADDGLSIFKSNFNPYINEFIGEFDLPVNPLLYKASEIAYNIRKRKNKKN